MPITATIEFQCDYCGVIARQPYTDAARPRMEAAGWLFVENDIFREYAFCPAHRAAAFVDHAREYGRVGA